MAAAQESTHETERNPPALLAIFRRSRHAGADPLGGDSAPATNTFQLPDTPEPPVRQPSSHRRPRRAKRAGHPPVANATHSLPAPAAPLSDAFRALGVDDLGLNAIAALGYQSPTPIQALALPALLAGEDVVGLAQTGTGKTLAFGLPLARAVDPAVSEVQAIVLVPTRELARQVCEVIDHLGRFYGYTTIGIIGGSRVRSDLQALERGGQVVVGTPGRVMDHMRRGTLSLAGVRFAVLDEADQMLDIGFARDIDYILRATPRARQTGLFSATMPESIGRLVHRYLRNARHISIDPQQRAADGIDQYFCEVSERDKFLALRHLFENHSLGRTLIFRRTRAGVDRLTELLNACGVQARAIHGDLRQGQRNRVMEDFRSGRLDMLVATNVASRGLDIPDITDIVNYDVPQNAEEYIHRIGRTARAGKQGRAFTFVSEWDLDGWDAIRSEAGQDSLAYLELPARWD